LKNIDSTELHFIISLAVVCRKNVSEILTDINECDSKIEVI